MKLATLFSGGKDSTYATFVAKNAGYEIACLISINSENKDSYMFHTPSILKTEAQAKAMNIPIIIQKTKGEKETELKDLEKAIKKAIKKYKIEGVITGAVQSTYQSCRIQAICNKLGIECFNPLWQKEKNELLNDLLKNKFEVIITAVAAYQLDQSWLGRKFDKKYIENIDKLNKKYGISQIGEGGEFETFVTNCPLFNKPIKIKSFKDTGSGNAWRRELEVGK